MTSSKIVRKATNSIVDDWIIAPDTVSYAIGAFVCVNFADNSKMYNSYNAVYYQNPEGGANIITE
jgi:hypothetical protein